MPVAPIPAGHNTVSPYLVVENAAALAAFLVTVFDAVEIGRLSTPDGKIAHAELRIGDTVLMLGDQPAGSPGASGMLHVYVPDVDQTYARALAAGAVSTRPPTDMFYGDRTAMFNDAWGNRWALATHIEDMSIEEMGRRMNR